jgi:hypothetical protein
MNLISSAEGYKNDMIKKLLIVIVFISLPIISFSARELETDYPSPSGGEVSDFENIFQYVKYIFEFSVWIIGAIAFVLLIKAGVTFLTSTGNPSAIKNAKDQIFAIIIGLAILFGSVFILDTINPELIKLEEKEMEKIEKTPLEVQLKNFSPDPLIRIREISEQIKNKVVPELIKKNEELKKLVEKCNCAYSSSKCDCMGWTCAPVSEGGECYGDPCFNREEIIKKQREIVLITSQLIYYKNRLDSEREDIRPELDRFIHQGRLTENQANNLEDYLESIFEPIEELSSFSFENSDLPDQCITPEKCHGNCGGGCHDGCEGTKACYPKSCSGGNPCPTSEIEKNIEMIKNKQKEVNNLCNKIISILK